MPTTRDRILDAAEAVLRTAGFAHATTKEIARTAGFSEATLYKHFPDKTAIFIAVLQERLPSLTGALGGLTPGEGSMAANLTAVARAALDFYLHSFPISVSVFSSRPLLETHAAGLRAMGAGPDKPLAGLADYLSAERALGRVRGDVTAASALLLGACFQRVFLLQFDGPPSEEELDTWASSYGQTVLAALT